MFLKRSHSETAGFTLIEMLIVIAVIVALASILLPSFKGMQEESNLAAAKKELQSIQASMEVYYIHNHAYPTALTTLLSANPNVLQEIPEDRFNRPQDYQYYQYGGQWYVLWSNGPDNKQQLTIDEVNKLVVICESCDDVVVTNANRVYGGKEGN